MNTKKLLKIVAFIIGPLVPLVIVIYFLFPYINEEKYEEIAKKKESLSIAVEGQETGTIGGDFETIKEQAEKFQQQNRKLQNTLDSLRTINDSLKTELAFKTEEAEESPNNESEENGNVGAGQAESFVDNLDEENEEEFKENIKSFLSLDDENLAPIINEMSDDQLVRLYKGGSSLQRKKLLRSLESKRAAKLMTEVM